MCRVFLLQKYRIGIEVRDRNKAAVQNLYKYTWVKSRKSISFVTEGVNLISLNMN